MGRAREKSRYPCGSHEWAWLGFLSVLHGVVSSVLSSSVVLCWSQCDWLQLGWRCDSSTGSVGSPSASVGSVFFLKYVVFWGNGARPEKEKEKKNCTGWTKALTTLMLLGCKVPVCVICCIGDVCLGGCCVFSGCQSSSGVGASSGLLPCVSCFCFCLKVGGQAVKVGGRGPSVAQCPELATLGSMRCLRGSCAGMQEWGNGWYQSYRSSCWVGDLLRIPLFLRRFWALCMKVVVSSLKKWMLEMVVAEWRCCQHVSASPPCRANSCECVSDLPRPFCFYWEKVWVNLSCSLTCYLYWSLNTFSHNSKGLTPDSWDQHL